MEELLFRLPESLQHRVFLDSGILYLSEELKGDPDMLSFVSLAERYGVINREWLKPHDFDEKYAWVTAPANETDIKKEAIKLFQDAYDEGASDIHILNYGSYGLIQFRRLGLMKNHSHMKGERVGMLIAAIYGTMTTAGDTQYSPQLRQDGRIVDRTYLPGKVHSMRVHTEPIQCRQSTSGTGNLMVIRLHYDSTKAKGTIEERVMALGYSEEDAEKIRFLSQRTGLTIISGPTGHGKSTLLKHIMECQAYENPEKSYMSLEDPSEFSFSGNIKQQLLSNIVSEDTDADPFLQRTRKFQDAIGGSLRSDLDVWMLGEIRFPEAAIAAIDEALTGHSVWTTLHANNAFGIIKRMVSLLNAAHFAEPLDFLCDVNVIAGLIYQRLLPTLCDNCKRSFSEVVHDPHRDKNTLPDSLIGRVGSVIDAIDNVYVRGKGCPQCKGLGIVGQTVAAEIVVCDEVILRYLREGKFSEATKYWVQQGGRSYVDHAIQLIAEGKVDPYLAEGRLGVPLNLSSIFDSFRKKSEQRVNSYQMGRAS